MVGAVCFQIHLENEKYGLVKRRDHVRIRQCLLGLRVYHFDEGHYPEHLSDLYPEIIGDITILECPEFLGQPAKPYIYLGADIAMISDSSGKTPQDVPIVVSPIPYPRALRQVGFRDGAVGFVHEKDLPDLKNHFPAN